MVARLSVRPSSNEVGHESNGDFLEGLFMDRNDIYKFMTVITKGLLSNPQQ